jgi:hypothetical protein
MPWAQWCLFGKNLGHWVPVLAILPWTTRLSKKFWIRQVLTWSLSFGNIYFHGPIMDLYFTAIRLNKKEDKLRCDNLLVQCELRWDSVVYIVNSRDYVPPDFHQTKLLCFICWWTALPCVQCIMALVVGVKPLELKWNLNFLGLSVFQEIRYDWL